MGLFVPGKVLSVFQALTVVLLDSWGEGVLL